MVHVVGALIAPAGLVLLDEPTCGLDPDRRAALVRLTDERGFRTALLIATQDDTWGELTRHRIHGFGDRVSSVASRSKKTD
jgi:alpha-D-ribose 1-methylphosphonate 5-triphosphate synthase subunit PhnL